MLWYSTLLYTAFVVQPLARFPSFHFITLHPRLSVLEMCLHLQWGVVAVAVWARKAALISCASCFDWMPSNNICQFWPHWPLPTGPVSSVFAVVQRPNRFCSRWNAFLKSKRVSMRGLRGIQKRLLQSVEQTIRTHLRQSLESYCRSCCWCGTSSSSFFLFACSVKSWRKYRAHVHLAHLFTAFTC